MKIERMPARAEHGLALPIMAGAPEGCMLFASTDASCEPIIRSGDLAVIDVTDRELVAGELYLRRYCPPGRRSRELAIVEAIRLRTNDNPAGYWMLGPHRRRGAVVTAILSGERKVWCDGPFDCKSLQERIVGRVVGVVQAQGPGRAESRSGGLGAAEVSPDFVVVAL